MTQQHSSIRLTRRGVLGAGTAFVAHACLAAPGNPSGSTVPWNDHDIPETGRDFRFAVVADRTTGAREGVFPKALKQLEWLAPDFVTSIGDFVQGLSVPGYKPINDKALITDRRQKIDAMVRNCSLPFCLTPGNHDINNEVSLGLWTDLYGTRYHSYVHEDVLFLSMDSQGGRNFGSGLDEKQLNWAEDVLAKHRDARWTFVYMHQPLWLYERRNKKAYGQFQRLEHLLAGRQYTVFAGHHHHYQRYERKKMTYIKLATTGGKSKLRGPKHGEFDHVMMVKMTADGPKISNVMLDGILNETGKPVAAAAPPLRGGHATV